MSNQMTNCEGKMKSLVKIHKKIAAVMEKTLKKMTTVSGFSVKP